MEGSKTCKTCGETKPLSEFYKSPANRDGLKGDCKTCYQAKRSTPEAKARKNAAQNKKYHSDPSYAHKKNEHQRSWQKSNPFKAALPSYRHRAKKRGVPFNLDVDYLEAIWVGVCPVFGTKLDLPHSKNHAKGAHSKHQPSLDRIRPDMGYVKGNVIWISSTANLIKSDASSADILAVGAWLQQTEEEIAKHEAD